jgi:hypothetical protein
MAMRAALARPVTRSDQDDEMLTRYMRALLRNGHQRLPGDDVRTCTACGTRALFERCADNDTWSSCSLCGALA